MENIILNVIKKFRFLGLVLFFAYSYQANAQCGTPVVGCAGTDFGNFGFNSDNDAATIEYDNFVATFHSTLVRDSDGNFQVWGEEIGHHATNVNSFTDLLNPVVINNANFHNGITGTPLKAALGGFYVNNVQGILLTTTGLHAWGRPGVVLDATLTTNWRMQPVTVGGNTNGLPTGVTPAQVKMMFVTGRTIAITTCGGDVYVLSQRPNIYQPGGSSTLWTRVRTNEAGNPYLTNVIVTRGANGVMFALRNDNTLWTWGDYTYLGDNTATNATRDYATQMESPVPAGTDIKMIGANYRTLSNNVGSGNGAAYTQGRPSYYVLDVNGNLYAMGRNNARQLGDWTTTDRLTWVQPRYTSAVGPVMDDIKWISPLEHDWYYGSVNVITDAGILYNWGDNNNRMLGRSGVTTQVDPGIPDYNMGSNTPNTHLAVESGGHTTMITMQCIENFGYAGHRIRGSMGNGSAATATEAAITFATAAVQICGAETIPNVTKVTVNMNSDGTTCEDGTITLIPDIPGGTYSFYTAVPGSPGYDFYDPADPNRDIPDGSIANLSDGNNGTPGDSQNTLSFTGPGRVKVVYSVTGICGPVSFVTADIIVLECEADLEVTKTVSPTSVNIGDTVVFTITVNNLGPQRAKDVHLMDLLPAGYTYDSHTVSVGTYNSGTGIWNGFHIIDGGTEILTITATVNANGPYLNTATITSPTSDPNPNNNTDDAGITLITADLEIAKSVSPNSVNVGGTVTFTMTVTNNGSSEAVNVEVTDVVPSGYTIGTINNGGINTTGTIVWSVGNLANGASTTVSFTATVNATGAYSNTATVNSDTADPDPDNNTSTTTPNVVPQADVQIVKAIDNTTPNVGDTVTFTMTVTNNGPSEAVNVEVTDVVPSGYTVGTINNGGVNTAGTIVWLVGNLANGASTEVSFEATVNATGTYSNTATVNSDTADPDSDNNTNTVIPTPVPQADVQIVKVIDNTTPDVGDIVTFTMTVTNNGPSEAVNVEVTDVVPSGYTIGTINNGGTNTTGTIVWSVGNLANGASTTVSFTATVNATGAYSNTATVDSDIDDPDPDNNTSTVTPTPVSQADLDIVKAVNNTTPNVGDTVTFTMTVTNNGPSEAVNVEVTDVVPSGYTIGTINNGGVNTAGTIVWTIGNLASGASTTVSFEATVNATGTYSNTATVNSDTTDPDPDNNTSTITPTPVPQADVQIVKAIDNTTPDVGDTVTFTMTVTNNGPSEAVNVEVTDVVPSGYTIETINNGGINTTGTIVWSVGNLANGASTTVSFTATVNATGAYSNTATVNSDTADPDPNNNTSTITPTPVPQADVQIVKTIDNTTPNVGDTVTFTMTVTNNGPSEAVNVEVTDVVPSGYTIGTINNSGVNTAGTIVWTIGNLANGASTEVSFEATVNATGTYSNTATVNSDTADPDSDNNTNTVIPTPNNFTYASNDINNTYINTPVSGSVAVNDNDPEGHIQTYTPIDNTDADGNHLVLNADGTYTFTPGTDFTGTLVYTYTVCDDGTPQACATATLTIEVLPYPVPGDNTVTANDDTATTEEGQPVTINVTANDFDMEGNTFTVTANTQPANGTLIDNGDGTFTYTPNAGFEGVDTFEYTICDDQTPQACDTATVTITVLPDNGENDTYANDDAFNGNQDTNITGNILLNDADPEGNTQTVTGNTNPANGGVVVDTDGTFVYIPNPGYFGPDQFTYTVCDNGTPEACDTATVYLTINPINTTYAENDINNTYINTPVSGSVAANDNDPEGHTQTYTPIDNTDADGNHLVLNVDGTYTFTPGTDFTGTLVYAYTVCDDGTPQACDTATLTIEVLPYPVPGDNTVTANDDTATTEEGQPVTINVTANDFDMEGNTFTVTANTQPANGTLIDNGDGTFTYTPNAGFEGVDTFEYTICDDGTPQACDTATVTITVLPDNGENDTYANDDTFNGNQDTPITGNVLNNDTDPEGNTQTVTGNTSPANGTVVVNPDGTFTYTPNDGYFGPDQFTYTVCDNGTPQACDEATVYLTVNPVNTTYAENDINITLVDTPVSGNVLVNDFDFEGDNQTVTSGDTTSANGGTIVWDTVTGTYTYTPAPGFVGEDTFTYTICDDGTPQACDTATVTITVVPAFDSTNDNNDVVANDDTATTVQETPVNINVVANDYDPDGDTFTVTANTQPANGTLVDNGDGTFTYTPNPGFEGIDTFEYTICDDATPQACDTATVTITVLPVGTSDNYTFANDDLYYGPSNADIIGNILTNDTDPEGNTQTVTSNTNPTNGTVIVNPDGTFVYTPNPDFSGIDQFTYTVCDDGTPQACDTATVYILIESTPALELLKSGVYTDDNADGEVNVGDSIVYTFTVTNTGNVTIDNITIDDTTIGVTDLAVTPDPLAPGESGTATATYMITQDDIEAGGVWNLATVTGEDPSGNPVTDDSEDPDPLDPSDPNYDPACPDCTFTGLPAPRLHLLKSGTYTDVNTDGEVNVGDSIVYTFTVTNTGNVTIDNITIDDTTIGVTDLVVTPDTLASGENGTATATYMITQEDIDHGGVWNLATVTGEDPSGNPVTDDSEDPNPLDPSDPNYDPACPDCTFTDLQQNPELELWKDGTYTDVNTDGTVNVGDTIIYEFTVTNTGNVTIDNIEITDPMLNGGAPIAVTPDTLAPGQSGTATATYFITQTDIEVGQVLNIAFVEGTDPSGNPVDDESEDPTKMPGQDPDDPTTIVVLDQDPAISLTKEGFFNDENGDGQTQAGETITYTFVATNTGNTILYDVTVTEMEFTGSGATPVVTFVSSTLGSPEGTLLVGESAIYTATYTIVADDIRRGSIYNQAIAEGQTNGGIIVAGISDDPNDLNDLDTNNVGYPNDPTVVELDGCEIRMNNGISPNDDGFNDYLHIRGLGCYVTNSIEVFNRWGVKVFEAKDYDNSDEKAFKGYSNGRTTLGDGKLPAGHYWYVLKYTEDGGATYDKVGYIYVNQ